MYCNNCGAELRENSIFCMNCGARVRSENVATFRKLPFKREFASSFSLFFLPILIVIMRIVLELLDSLFDGSILGLYQYLSIASSFKLILAGILIGVIAYSAQKRSIRFSLISLTPVFAYSMIYPILNYSDSSPVEVYSFIFSSSSSIFIYFLGIVFPVIIVFGVVAVNYLARRIHNWIARGTLSFVTCMVILFVLIFFAMFSRYDYNVLFFSSTLKRVLEFFWKYFIAAGITFVLLHVFYKAR